MRLRSRLALALTAAVLILPSPYPDKVVRWVADELVGESVR